MSTSLILLYFQRYDQKILHQYMYVYYWKTKSSLIPNFSASLTSGCSMNSGSVWFQNISFFSSGNSFSSTIVMQTLKCLLSSSFNSKSWSSSPNGSYNVSATLTGFQVSKRNRVVCKFVSFNILYLLY